MKRICIILLSLLLLFALAGCGNDTVAVIERGPYYASVDGQQLTIDPVKGTITAENGDVYTYVINGTEVTFTYPNGYQYIWNYGRGVGLSTLSGNPDGYRYLSEFALEIAVEPEVEANNPKPKDPGSIFCAIVCFLIGGVNLVFPYAGWYLRYGLYVRDAQPSDAALVIWRITGGIVICVGFWFLFM